MTHRSVFIYSPDCLAYRFHSDHPFDQRRLVLTVDLLQEWGLIAPGQIIAPRVATDDELQLAHESTYIDAVKRASENPGTPEAYLAYNIGTEDNPAFAGMHEAAALAVGGTLLAAEWVMEGKADHAVNLAGGLHHALRGRASGFCIYNDCAVAIAWLRRHYGARVLYLDTDAHHGDGVQWAFYDDPDVLTVSLHETGRTLFPGTGFVHERGDGPGFGRSINVPLEPFTEDDSWLECYTTVVERVAHRFRPDIIITQNGCDAHVWDPLSHLCATTRIYAEIPKLAHRLAHELCDGRLVAVGGGGYDIWRVVPRAWALLWAELVDRPFAGNPELPPSWRERWQAQSPVPLPQRLLDPPDIVPPIPRRSEIDARNRHTVELALLYAP
ncbi:MAG: acetoin utilization protein AcuC [Calditerricola sp.]|nr:acetoin utilization protein AcuC [Calditerricola sp.]